MGVVSMKNSSIGNTPDMRRHYLIWARGCQSSTNLVKRLHIRGAEDERLTIALFGNKLPKKCNSKQSRRQKYQFYNEKNKLRKNDYWKQPETLIGVKNFFKFIKLDVAKELESGLLLFRIKLGPMLAGNGYMDNICKASAALVNSAVSCVPNATTHEGIDHFWKLKLLGIQDQSNENDDEQAPEQFKKTITKQDGR
ncbi:hypothetical protein LOAG_18382 [Loa loa]|uniref:Uncharacterized protein n=1 Tax=Loa loa TaxID=7209 RepID=A0A1S0UFF4_LOALO|nr:hypothetical protein LOAG_18382 [Loa loa]EJD74283.1 hypothetical protein LOAG_18382 [Loa loa]